MLARSRSLRWCVAPLGLALYACGGDGVGDGPTEPPPTPRQPAVIALVSGNDQDGKAGGVLADPLAVRVTDARGDGLGGVKVTWHVTSGAGELWSEEWEQLNELRDEGTRTDATGVTRIFFRPTVVGTSTVTAEVGGIQGSPVVFVTNASVMVIGFGYFSDCTDDEASFFQGPDGSRDVAVPVGTTVEWWGVGTEWLPASCTNARIASTLEPPGGEPFDSGILTLDDSFEFTPGVAGTWEYVDQITGETGTLTAQ